LEMRVAARQAWSGYKALKQAERAYSKEGEVRTMCARGLIVFAVLLCVSPVWAQPGTLSYTAAHK